jgi:hypothetical protein
MPTYIHMYLRRNHESLGPFIVRIGRDETINGRPRSATGSELVQANVGVLFVSDSRHCEPPLSLDHATMFHVIDLQQAALVWANTGEPIWILVASIEHERQMLGRRVIIRESLRFPCFSDRSCLRVP